MSVELPKDAEGREIPLDTEVLYDICGTKVSVKEFLSSTSVENQRTEWTIKAQYEGNLYYNSFKSKNMHLTPSDSWEKLEEDLSRVKSRGDLGDDLSVCAYTQQSCEVCKFQPSRDCTGAMCADIASRIRKLRGED